MYLPYGWQNMTANALDQYLASHSQAEIKAENERLYAAADVASKSQSPTTNQPIGETPLVMPTMNFEPVSYGGGGKLMEGSAQADQQQSYFGAGGGPVGYAAASAAGVPSSEAGGNPMAVMNFSREDVPNKGDRKSPQGIGREEETGNSMPQMQF